MNLYVSRFSRKSLGSRVHQDWWPAVRLGGSLSPFPWTGWKKCTHPSPLPFLWLRAPGCICGTFPRPGLSGSHEGSPYGHRSVSSIFCPAVLSCQMPAVIGPPLEPARQSEQSCGNSCSTKLPSLDPFRLRLETFGNKIPCGMMGAQTHQPLGAP